MIEILNTPKFWGQHMSPEPLDCQATWQFIGNFTYIYCRHCASDCGIACKIFPGVRDLNLHHLCGRIFGKVPNFEASVHHLNPSATGQYDWNDGNRNWIRLMGTLILVFLSWQWMLFNVQNGTLGVTCAVAGVRFSFGNYMIQNWV